MNKEMAKNIIKETDGALRSIDFMERQVKIIDFFIEEGSMVVDMHAALASIDTRLYARIFMQGDEDLLLSGLCSMLRSWIDFQRAWKKGDLLRMLEAGELDTTVEKIEQEYAQLPEANPVRIVVVDDSGEPWMEINQTKAGGDVSYKTFDKTK